MVRGEINKLKLNQKFKKILKNLKGNKKKQTENYIKLLGIFTWVSLIDHLLSPGGGAPDHTRPMPPSSLLQLILLEPDDRVMNRVGDMTRSYLLFYYSVNTVDCKNLNGNTDKLVEDLASL